MSENDKKIRVVKTHDQGTGSIEFCIPKEFQKRYDLAEPGHLMLIPEEDYFKVMKLRLATSGEKAE
jgi:hypothetical protein